jgi:hypothetical protein
VRTAMTFLSQPRSDVSAATRRSPATARAASLRCAAFAFALAGIAAADSPVTANPFELDAVAVPAATLDKIVFRQLDRLGITPARPSSDAVFLRRAFLDTIGTLPTAAEARQFLQDRDPMKRERLVDRLLARDEFADYWAMKWSDLLRVKAEFPINLWPNAAQAYHQWIRAAIRDNLPYDRFARELLTSSGSNFRVGPVNFYRAMQSRESASIARTVALTFMGSRAEKWPAGRLEGMAAFFVALGYKATGEWKEEIVFFDREKFSASCAAAAPAAGPHAMFPDGTVATLSPARDPREVFADWLIDPKNPWFARAIANRVWSWLEGRGIVHEPDDLRPDNPPANPELLAFLEKELVDAHFDLKHLFRIILTSQTYQLSSIARSDHPAAEANFAFYPLRRLDAEVLIDALNQVTGTVERYSSAIPEPFTFIPEEQRSIALPDGSITSSFLELFGRPARDTGLETERNNRITAAQRLHLLNSAQIQRKIEQGPKLLALIRARGAPREIVDNLYLAILSRWPTDRERQAALAHAEAAADPRAAAQDVAWALFNSTEFLYRH